VSDGCLNRDLQLLLVTEAGRAPSPHNTQPARWRFRADGRLELWEDRTRWLSVGDPSGRDADIALGAAFEGMAIALSRHGFTLGEPEMTAPRGAEGPLRVVATTGLRLGARTDPLAGAIAVRRTWRRLFLPVEPGDEAIIAAAGQGRDVVFLTGDDHRRALARAFDLALVAQLLLPGVVEELRDWVRFTPRDPRWFRDGLAADAIGIGRFARHFAPAVLSTPAVRWLNRAGVLRLLFSEAAAIRSATALVVLHRPRGEHPFRIGRRFYRLWLEWTRAGFGACPMSALADHAPTASMLRQRFGIPSGSAVVNVFRVGRTPADGGRSSRLPAKDLLLTDP
jgi:nitroreductase